MLNLQALPSSPSLYLSKCEAIPFLSAVSGGLMTGRGHSMGRGNSTC